MPNYDAIVINAATINAKCSNCRRSLDEEASLNIRYGFYDKHFCPQCLMDILSGYPKLRQDLDKAHEDLKRYLDMTDAFEKEVMAQVKEIEKKLVAKKPVGREPTTQPKVVPANSKEKANGEKSTKKENA